MLRPASLVMVVLSGCSFGFDSPSLVKDLRVLAIQVEPPELTLATAASGLTVRALVVSSQAVDPIDWSLGTCLVAPTGSVLGVGQGNGTLARCPAGASVLAGGSTSLDAIAFEGAPPVEVLGILQSAPGLAPQLQLELTVGATPLYAEKAVRVTTALPPGQAPNKNPVLTGVTFDGQDWVAGTPITLKPGACPADKLETVTNTDGTRSSLCTHELVPTFDDTQRQYYLGQSTTTGELVTQQERLRFAWFTNQGAFHHDTTQQPASTGTSPQTGDVSNVWREGVGLSGDVTFWIVVRDGRGGESWETRLLHFEG